MPFGAKPPTFPAIQYNENVFTTFYVSIICGQGVFTQKMLTAQRVLHFKYCACSKEHAEKSAIAEHAWDQQHTIDLGGHQGAGQGHKTYPASS